MNLSRDLVNPFDFYFADPTNVIVYEFSEPGKNELVIGDSTLVYLIIVLIIQCKCIDPLLGDLLHHYMISLMIKVTSLV